MAYGRTNAATRRRGMFTFTVGDTVYEYDGKNDLDNSSIKTETNTTNKTVKCWIKASGTLYFKTLPKSKKARAFACGAGGNGSNGGYPYGEYQNKGGGGGGGYTSSTNSYDLVKRTNLSIVVGSGATEGFGLTANKGGSAVSGSREGGEGTGRGGKGAMCYWDPWRGTNPTSGSDGADGVYAFGESAFDGIKYGAGGGGGQGYGCGPYHGGTTGGGNGFGSTGGSTAGQANTGGGGGGGGSSVEGGACSGGTGIFIFETLAN